MVAGSWLQFKKNLEKPNLSGAENVKKLNYFLPLNPLVGKHFRCKGKKKRYFIPFPKIANKISGKKVAVSVLHISVGFLVLVGNEYPSNINLFLCLQ